MNDVLALTPGTVLLLLVLTLAMLLGNLLLQLLRMHLRRHGLAAWLTDNEPTLVVALWAVLALFAYFIGPSLMMAFTGPSAWALPG
ncbi:MAG: hypothetical protein AB1421_08420 [Pseudomonadota bacterium]